MTNGFVARNVVSGPTGDGRAVFSDAYALSVWPRWRRPEKHSYGVRPMTDDDARQAEEGK